MKHRATIVLVCFGIGVIPLLLLNGQAFTNSLIALPFFLVATALCLAAGLDQRTPEHRKRSWRLAAMLTALLTIGVVFSLPAARRTQKGFNESIVRARQIAAEAVKRGQKL